jgi:clan AA aspartic protease (TIGR02281 family)
MKKLLLTSAVLLLASPALADKMGSNPLTPSEYNDSVRTLDEKYAALRQQRENEYAALREQKQKELAALEARITSAKEELTRAREELAEALNRNNSRKIQAGLPAEIDSAPQKVRLLMEPGTVRVWPAARPFMSVIVGSKVLDAKPSDGDAGNADLVITAQEEKGYGNIILTDEKGEVIADIQVKVGHPEDKMKGSDQVQHVKISDDGHFYPKVSINGTAVRLMADTGATFVSLSAEDARKAGVDLRSLPVNGKAQTANGVVQDKQFLLPEITVEGFVLRNVPASCCVTGTSLLGMSALGQLGFQMKDGWMFLSPKS